MAIKDLFIRLGLKGAKKTTKGLGTVNNGLKSLASSALKIGAVFYAAKGLISGLQHIVSVSSGMKAVGEGFTNLSNKVGLSSDTLSKLTAATDGTVSSLELMTQANNAMLLGITDSEDQMAEMFDTAQRLAAALGQDTAFGVDSLVTGLGRQSKLMLDNLGIMVDVEKANKDYAASLNKTVKELTDQEKKTAFVNASLEEASRLVSQLGEEELTTADRINQLKSSATNMAGVLGEALTPAFNASLDALSGFSGKVTEAVNSLTKIDFSATGKNIIQNTEALMTALRGTFAIFIDAIPDLFKKAFDKVYPILEKFFTGLLDGVKIVAKMLWDPLVIAFQHMGAKIQNGWVSVMNTLISGLNSVIEATNKVNFFGEIPTVDLMDKVEIDPLLDKLAETDIGKALFGGEDNIQTGQEFVDATAEIWTTYFDQVRELKTVDTEGTKENLSIQVEEAKKASEQIREFKMEDLNTFDQFAKAGMNLATNLFNHETTLIDNKMNKELKAKQKSFDMQKASLIAKNTLNGVLTEKGQKALQNLEEGHGASTENIKEKYRQKSIAAEKKLKPMKYAQAISNTALAVTGALGNKPWTPINFALAGLVAAAGAAEIATINAQEFASGGIVKGVGSSDTVPAMLTPGELILNQAQQENLSGAVGGLTLNISAPLVDETVLDTIIPAIEKAKAMNLA